MPFLSTNGLCKIFELRGFRLDIGSQFKCTQSHELSTRILCIYALLTKNKAYHSSFYQYISLCLHNFYSNDLNGVSGLNQINFLVE